MFGDPPAGRLKLFLGTRRGCPGDAEFGLPGAQAEGLRADLPIADTGEFPTPPESRATFHLLTAWDLGGEAMERIGDLSDVEVSGGDDKEEAEEAPALAEGELELEE